MQLRRLMVPISEGADTLPCCVQSSTLGWRKAVALCTHAIVGTSDACCGWSLSAMLSTFYVADKFVIPAVLGRCRLLAVVKQVLEIDQSQQCVAHV